MSLSNTTPTPFILPWFAWILWWSILIFGGCQPTAPTSTEPDPPLQIRLFAEVQAQCTLPHHCDDGDPCTRDTCDEASGTCAYTERTNTEHVRWASGRGPGNGVEEYNQVQCVAYAQGYLLTCDAANGRIPILDPSSGQRIGVLGQQGSGLGQLNNPSAVAFDASGYLYVADRGNHRIQVFEVDLEQAHATALFSFGRGRVEGDLLGLNAPVALAFSPRGDLYVSEYGNHRLQGFEVDVAARTARSLGVWGRNGGDGTRGSGAGEFFHPWGLFFDPEGRLFVADSHNHRIQILDSSPLTGQLAYRAHFGQLAVEGMVGRFLYPTGLHLADHGALYISERQGNRIQLFQVDPSAQTAEYQFALGRNGGDTTSGLGAGEFASPRDVTLSPTGQHLFVADTANHRVQAFEIDRPDPDGDGLCNEVDNCPALFNAGQVDADNNGVGDECQPPNLLPTLDVDPFDVSTYSPEPIALGIQFWDTCPNPPTLQSPVGARADDTLLIGGAYLTRWTYDIATSGLFTVAVSITSGCGGPTLSATRTVAVDSQDPAIVYHPDFPEVAPTEPPEAWPVWRSDMLIPFDPVAQDATSGVVALRAVLEDGTVVGEQLWERSGTPSRGQPAPVALSCFEEFCPEPTMLDLSFVPPGPHCLTVSAEDASGRSSARSWCFQLSLGQGYPIDHEAFYPLLCTTLEELAHDVNLPDAERALELCHQGAACLNDEPSLPGCALMALIGIHKTLLNMEVDLGRSNHAFRDSVVRTALGLLERNDQALSPNTADLLSLDKARAAVAKAEEAERTSDAMQAAEIAWFWYGNARNPLHATDDLSEACTMLAHLQEEMVTYPSDGPGRSALEPVTHRMTEAYNHMCSDRTPAEACYDISVLGGLVALTDAANTLNRLRLDLQSDAFLIWTRNWRLGLARIAQAWLTTSLANVEAWLLTDAIYPNYDPTLLSEATARWADAERLLEEDALDAFMGRFIDPASLCLMHDLYEIPNDWWNDARNPICDLFPYTKPEACSHPWSRNGLRTVE
ncbi:MAG: NHL repeat-containing protein [Myxococcota bacterium]